MAEARSGNGNIERTLQLLWGRLGEGVIERVRNRADRGSGTDLVEPLGEAHGRELRPGIGVCHQPDSRRRPRDRLATSSASWVHWFNEHRRHGHCGDVPPAELEAAFYAARQADPAGVGNQ